MNEMMIPEEVIMSKILLIWGMKVMIDSDLAELYGVTTKRLNEQVKRNILRFPIDFMFQLTEEEKREVVANCDHLNRIRFSSKLPFAFTEHGAVMLASVLNNERAIHVNILIVRVFIRIRHLLETHTEILRKLTQIETKEIEQDQKIMLIFEYLHELEENRQQEEDFANQKRIGYRR